MAAKNKRIALTVPPDIDAVLAELSRLTNTPKTAIVMELITDLTPSLQQVITSIKQVKEGQKEIAVQGMMDLMVKASTRAKQGVLEMEQVKGEILGEK